MSDKDTPNGMDTRDFFVFRECVEENRCPGRKIRDAVELSRYNPAFGDSFRCSVMKAAFESKTVNIRGYPDAGESF